jgi:hypothetical protein
LFTLVNYLRISNKKIMKANKLITGLMIVFTVICDAQIKPYMSFESGLTQWNTCIEAKFDCIDNYQQFDFSSSSLSLYSTVLIGFHYKGFKLENSISTYFDQGGSAIYNFTPLKAEYLFNFHYSFKNYEIGVKHQCDHTVIAYEDTDSHNIYSAYYSKLYIKITFGDK